jgi:large subunit ribosomal protein L2
MGIITRKPQNASLRFQTFIDTSELTQKKPERRLVRGLKKTGGRNAYGRITSRGRGGGAPRKYRIIDFARLEKDVKGRITSVEYDPNRNVRIGLVAYENGAKHYMLMPQDLTVGSWVIAGRDVEPKVGNSLPLRAIPIGFMIHNVEIRPGGGGTFARSAGTSVQLTAKEGDYATLKMPSGEIRKVHLDCWATIGVLGNPDHKNVTLGKAGRSRYAGRRPLTRGMAKNPIDHPHGGGEGRSKSGAHPQSPWGKGSKGTKTRKRKNDLILQRRK